MEALEALGFTGGRHIPPGIRHRVYSTLTLLLGDEYVTGACIGIDAYVGAQLARLYPAARHRVIVPADRSQVDPWWTTRLLPRHFELEFMPPGTSYRQRNERIVERSGSLCGYPAHAEDHPRSRRSGTWQTIRLARKAGMPVRVVVLDDLAQTG